MADTREMHLYLLALGSNQARSALLGPATLLLAAAERIRAQAGNVVAIAPVILTLPLGPSRRRYANSALLLDSALAPPALLTCLQEIERQLGRQRARRWGERRIDIDIILWSGGRLDTRNLHLPHRAMRQRDFVLRPAIAIAPHWRDPVTGLTLRHLHARLHKPCREG